jgi:hypothetical protein
MRPRLELSEEAWSYNPLPQPVTLHAVNAVQKKPGSAVSDSKIGAGIIGGCAWA